MNKKTDYLKNAINGINDIKTSVDQDVLARLNTIENEIQSAMNAINKDDLFISNFSKELIKERDKINLKISKFEDHVANRHPNRNATQSRMY